MSSVRLVDYTTLFSPDSTTAQRLLSLCPACSEFKPCNISDVNDAWALYFPGERDARGLLFSLITDELFDLLTWLETTFIPDVLQTHGCFAALVVELAVGLAHRVVQSHGEKLYSMKEAMSMQRNDTNKVLPKTRVTERDIAAHAGSRIESVKGLLCATLTYAIEHYKNEFFSGCFHFETDITHHGFYLVRQFFGVDIMRIRIEPLFDKPPRLNYPGFDSIVTTLRNSASPSGRDTALRNLELLVRSVMDQDGVSEQECWHAKDCFYYYWIRTLLGRKASDSDEMVMYSVQAMLGCRSESVERKTVILRRLRKLYASRSTGKHDSDGCEKIQTFIPRPDVDCVVRVLRLVNMSPSWPPVHMESGMTPTAICMNLCFVHPNRQVLPPGVGLHIARFFCLMARMLHFKTQPDRRGGVPNHDDAVITGLLMWYLLDKKKHVVPIPLSPAVDSALRTLYSWSADF